MPPEYINKLSQMFKDVKVSSDINDKFKHFARNNLLNNRTLTGDRSLSQIHFFCFRIFYSVKHLFDDVM